MLRALNITDFVIVDRIDLEFAEGFTALTGETGAGKSILIDALAMVLGARSDAAVVRQGAEKAEISAEFDIARARPLKSWLADNEFTGDDDTCFEYMYMRLLSTNPQPTDAQIRQQWVDHVPLPGFYIANRQARWLQAEGFSAPESGSINHW